MQFEPQSMKQLYEIMKTPAGQQLLSILQQKGGKDLEAALDSAKKGDYQQAQKMISNLLKDADTRNLLNQLGG